MKPPKLTMRMLPQEVFDLAVDSEEMLRLSMELLEKFSENNLTGKDLTNLNHLNQAYHMYLNN